MAYWQQVVDTRAQQGLKIGQEWYDQQGPEFRSKYSADMIGQYAGSKGYALGDAWQKYKGAQAPPSYDRVKLEDIGKLSTRLSYGTAWPGGSDSLKKVPGYQQLADYMGVKQINSPNEVKKALGILGATNNSWAVAQASRPNSGVANYNSLNDYLKVLGPGAASQSRAASAVGMPAGTGGNATTAATSSPVDSSPSAPEMPAMPAPPEFRFAPGGTGASVDAAATGFRRRKSSARSAGLTSKGTSQFKIAGQTARSSGLNIGV